jgi:ribosomal protein S18 acetylase RimI-like enzyme
MLFAYKVFISSSGEIIKDNSSSIIAGSIEYDLSTTDNYASLYNLYIKKPFRRKGFAKKLRSYAISKILQEKISKIITFPLSYTSELSSSDLLSFYVSNFKELGATEVKEQNLYNNKVKLIAYFS